MSEPYTSLEIRSRVTEDATLEVFLDTVEIALPGEEEVVVRMQAAPIHPSDLGLLLGPADMETARAEGRADAPRLVADIPQAAMGGVGGRLGQPMAVGNEGAGVVVAAGAAAEGLIGRTVALSTGGTYAQYKKVSSQAVMPLPKGTEPRAAAACFVNPLTALGMVETLKLEGHTGLVHTAAASNLGQMLVKLCLADDVPLVNIVRRPEHVALLRGLGAKHVCDSTSASFQDELTDALADTGATLAFDAIGGGTLAAHILTCMERAALRGVEGHQRYGSSTHKQVYVYGGLDTGPTMLERSFGMAWGIGGWLLIPFLAKIGMEGGVKLQQRVVAELETTFASTYSHTISLSEALQLDTVHAYRRKATGGKYLIDPSR